MAIKPISISQLNNYIGRVISTDPLIGNVTVIGEISNLKYHGTGHIYFSLKDETSTIRCFLHANYAQTLRYELAEGMEITAAGYVSVFERGGYYSFNVKDLEVSGQGSMAMAFEQIKLKLEKEGLFDMSHKKELPYFPNKIAIVTSETGAAVQDMLKIIRSRNNITDILIYPVIVQGPMAAPEISSAIKDLNENFTDIDLIIVGRGGGSMEDLWAFNEEQVARAIYDSKIPIISAVGHEIDFTISDFVADKRAETPTAAAAMAVPDVAQLKIQLEILKERSYQYLDNYIERNRNKIKLLKAKLDSLNPHRIVDIGYGAILDNQRKLIKSIKDISQNETLTIMLKDGEIEVEVKKITGADNE